MDTASLNKVIGLLRTLEVGAIELRLSIGEIIAEELEAVEEQTIKQACDTIAGQIEERCHIVKAGKWYQDCFRWHRVFLPHQKDVLLKNPFVTVAWVQYVSRLPEQERQDCFRGVTKVKPKVFPVPRALAPSARSSWKARVDTISDSGVVIPFPLDVDDIEVAISRLYAEANKALSITPLDVDKAIEEGRRRAGV